MFYCELGNVLVSNWLLPWQLNLGLRELLLWLANRAIAPILRNQKPDSGLFFRLTTTVNKTSYLFWQTSWAVMISLTFYIYMSNKTMTDKEIPQDNLNVWHSVMTHRKTELLNTTKKKQNPWPTNHHQKPTTYKWLLRLFFRFWRHRRPHFLHPGIRGQLRTIQQLQFRQLFVQIVHCCNKNASSLLLLLLGYVCSCKGGRGLTDWVVMGVVTMRITCFALSAMMSWNSGARAWLINKQ